MDLYRFFLKYSGIEKWLWIDFSIKKLSPLIFQPPFWCLDSKKQTTSVLSRQTTSLKKQERIKINNK